MNETTNKGQAQAAPTPATVLQAAKDNGNLIVATVGPQASGINRGEAIEALSPSDRKRWTPDVNTSARYLGTFNGNFHNKPCVWHAWLGVSGNGGTRVLLGKVGNGRGGKSKVVARLATRRQELAGHPYSLEYNRNDPPF